MILDPEDLCGLAMLSPVEHATGSLYYATVVDTPLFDLPHFVTEAHREKKIVRPQDIASAPESLQQRQRGSSERKHNFYFCENGWECAKNFAPGFWGGSVFFLRGFHIWFRTK